MPLKEIFNNSFDIKEDSNNFYLISEIKSITNAHIVYYLKQAEQYRATAVYFKPFDDKNTSIEPVCYVYDNSDNIFTKEDIAEIHKNLWNSGLISIYVVIDTYEIKIFNARKPVSVDENGIHAVELTEAVKISHLAVKELKKKQLSSQYLDSGVFNDFYKNDFVESTSPHYILLDRLKKIRTEILKVKELSLLEAFINKLLVIFILLKFIEEKTDNSGKRIVEFDKENIWQGESTFIEIIKKKDIVKFFEKLATKFNGHIFNLDTSEIQQLKELSQTHRYLLAGFFDANLDPNTWQYELWKQYSFNHLPIELISGIYEAFLPEKTKDIAYTPPYLVNLMIDECMPLNKHVEYFADESFKVLDPSCGSGIFIVTAFRRLVDWKIIKDFEKTGKWEVPKVDVLQKILRENIYGVDIKQGAAEIAIFSLQIALCRYLTPVSIWENLRFDNLGEEGKNPLNNIVSKDFFDYFNETELASFDLVCGNPPFEDIGSKECKDTVKHCKNYIPTSIAPAQIAFLFLDIATQLVKKEGKLSFVLPAQFIYNQSDVAVNFQQKFFERYQVNQIYDFTFLKDKIFKEKQIAVCSIILQNKTPNSEHTITHTVAKRLKQAEERLYFEFDYYDYHYVPLQIATKDHFVWKTNLLGGGSLYFTIRRLKQEQTFSDYLKNKIKNNGWVVGEGYDLVTSNEKKKGLEYVKENYDSAPHITGFDYVANEDFTLQGIKKVQPELDEYFHGTRKKNKEIFYNPHVLIRKIPTLPIHFLDYDLRFKNGIIGIHAPETEIEELKNIVTRFNKNKELYKFYLFCTSGRTGVNFSFSATQKSDIENLPYPKKEENIFLSHYETIQKEDIFNFIKYSSQNTENSVLNQPADYTEHLVPFAEVFKSIINKVHAKGDLQIRLGNVIDTDTCYCMALHFGDSELTTTNNIIKQDDLDESLKVLLVEELGRSYKNIRRIQYYTPVGNDDVVYLIKPKHLRYWLRSIAIRDADEMLYDLCNEGY